MANIQSKILKDYSVDIDQENIFLFYKITEVDLSDEDIEKKIVETRKRWKVSANGTNEKNAARDSQRLAKAVQYEKIIKNRKLRKELFTYYESSNGGTGNGKGGSTSFAREYFELIATTKKIKRKDVNFFFEYYRGERKNKKAILEMLTKDMKILGLGSKDGGSEDENDKDEGGKDGKKQKSKTNSALIVNLFQEATILKMRRAIEKYEEAIQNKEVCIRYPKVEDGLYEYLGIDDVMDIKQYRECMAAKGREVYEVRQEHGTVYVPLVDLFNLLQGLGENQDVADNILEFKLLLKYPSLTPFMFSFVEMKPTTLKKFVSVASKEYSFRDETDFILSYYQSVYDNFGINNKGIGALLSKAEKNTKKNKVLNKIDEKLGRGKNGSRASIGAEVIHFLAYGPIFILYFVFELIKLIFTKMHWFIIPICIAGAWLEGKLLSTFGIPHLWELLKLFDKEKWMACLQEIPLITGHTFKDTLDIASTSILVVVVLIVIYAIPIVCLFIFMDTFLDQFNKGFDWTGLDRTFKVVMKNMKKKTAKEYLSDRKLFYKRKVVQIGINIGCLLVLFGVFYFLSGGFGIGHI